MRHHPRVRELFGDAPVLVRSAPVDLARYERLSAPEQAAVSQASVKRQREYATARDLARGALRELGVDAFDLLNGDDRAPIWPAGIVGSISHCDTRAFVALGRAAEVGSVGIDVEHRTELKRDLWRMTLLPEEIAWLNTQASAGRGRLALAMFTAKEALYKAQYPRSTEYMGFMALRVELRGRELICTFQSEVGPFEKGFVARGRFVEVPSGELVAGVRIP